MTNSSLQLAGLFVFVHRRQDISQEPTKASRLGHLGPNQHGPQCLQDPLGCLTGELIFASWVSTYCYGCPAAMVLKQRVLVSRGLRAATAGVLL